MHSLALYLSFLHLLLNQAVTETLPPYAATDYILLNCGSSSNSTSLDGRNWDGDFNSKFSPPNIETTSIASTPSQHDPSVTQLPFTTARIFHKKFTYSFSVSPGLKFVRLYFFPSTYSGLHKSKSFSFVSANNFTVLSNFSAFLTVSSIKPPVASLIKEFIIPVLHTQFLNITFIPSPSSYAFINGIEIVSMPNNLYMHNRDDVMITMVDYNIPFYFDDTTALETMYRLNVGGNDISGVQDTGMFRTWRQDSQFLFDQMISMIPSGWPGVKIQFETDIPAYTAPEVVYQTSRIMGLNSTLNLESNLTWIFTVDGGFYYLFRLHFCETLKEVVEINQRVFDIFINNQTAEAQADVIDWSGGNGIPVYREYVVLIPSGNKAKQDLWLALHPDMSTSPVYASAILNGVEIFKLNRSDGSLAGFNPELKVITTHPAPESKTKLTERPKKLSSMIAIIIGGVVGPLLILFLVTFRLSKRAKDIGSTDVTSWWGLFSFTKTKSTKMMGSSLPSELCRKFSFAEIKAATNDFDTVLIIGVGGFGNVYKGYIDDGTILVAIKRLKSRSQQGAHEFHTEIAMLSQLRHRHLVSLIGYCNDDNEMILVYDYVSRGNLRDHLYDTKNPPLSWKQRLEICIGAAHGLQYLHNDAKHMIIHRDVKTTNILLNEKWVAKVSDFGLSKIGSTSEFKTHVSTMVKGSIGYMDPEYYRLQQLTEKSDVYSFGVVLCEVLCARPPLLRTVEKDQVSLAQWVPKCYHNKMLDQIVDPFLKGEIALECLEKFGKIAVDCLLDDRTKRPSMNEVVWCLELALQMQESANDINQCGEMKGPLFQELAEDDSDGMFIASSTEGCAKSTSLSMTENFANKDSDCLLPKSILYFIKDNLSINSVPKCFKLLRVLDLEGSKMRPEGELPEKIGTLIHLRFLSLKKTGIRELPPSIGNLLCLATLNLETIEEFSWESTVVIPTVIWTMVQLRHLYLPKWCDYSTDDNKLSLTNLSNLLTLVNFPANKCDVSDLLSLTCLRKLVLNEPRHFQEFGEIVNRPIGKCLNSLQSLSMKTELLSFPDIVVNLPQVVRGCPFLGELHVEGRIQKLPDYNHPHLTKLSLWGSRLVEGPLPILEKLPILRYLNGWDAFAGKKMVCSKDGFPKLKTLVLPGFPSLEEWTVEEGAMPCLFRLEILQCSKLKSVPDGLRFVRALQELEFRWMPIAFKHRLEKKGEDFSEVQHVPSIVFL